MDKLDIQEKLWGGVFGVIAIVAAIGEMFVNGVNTASILGMVKDVSGTLVVVIVMVAVARLIVPTKRTLSFEEKMVQSLNKWIDDHSNMIVRTSKLPKGHENDFGMSMTTDITRFYNTEVLKSDTGSGVGRFLRITEIDKSTYAKNAAHIDFFINAQTYCDPTAEDSINELLSVGHNLSAYIRGAVDGVTVGEPRKEGDRTLIIPVGFKNSIITNDGENIDLVINVIDRMYEAMLVSARRK